MKIFDVTKQSLGFAVRAIGEGLDLWTGMPESLKPLGLRFLGARTTERWLVLDFATTEDGCRPCCIVIDRYARRVIRNLTSDAFFPSRYGGSGAIGLAALTLPIAVPLMPYLVARRAAHVAHARLRRMDAYGMEIFSAVRGLLPPMLRDELGEALRNACTHAEVCRREVPFEEAKTLLRTVHLTAYESRAGVEYFCWSELPPRNGEMPEGDRMFAIGSRKGDAVTVDVYGSRFTGAEASELLLCFHIMRTVHRSRVDRATRRIRDEIASAK